MLLDFHLRDLSQFANFAGTPTTLNPITRVCKLPTSKFCKAFGKTIAMIPMQGFEVAMRFRISLSRRWTDIPIYILLLNASSPDFFSYNYVHQSSAECCSLNYCCGRSMDGQIGSSCDTWAAQGSLVHLPVRADCSGEEDNNDSDDESLQTLQESQAGTHRAPTGSSRNRG